jgi:nucleotide-binding universal stress UspA family protein
MKRFLVATDFSDASRDAVRYGLELTTAMEGDMLLLHVVEGDPIRTYTVTGLSDPFPSSLDLTRDMARVAVPRSSSIEICARKPSGSCRPCFQRDLATASAR